MSYLGSFRRGFAQIFVTLAITSGILAVFLGIIIISHNQKLPKTPITDKNSSKSAETTVKNSTPSAEIKPIVSPVANSPKPPPVAIPTNNLSSISIHIYDPFRKESITSGDFLYRIENTKTKERFESKGPLDWTKADLSAGPYKISVYFKDPYANDTGKCDSCSNSYSSQNESYMCGWNYELAPKDNPTFICGLTKRDGQYYESLIPKPAYTSPDTEAPRASFFWPQAGGTMSYKTEGKYCVIMNAPSDNRDTWDQLQVEYRFDSESWSGWQTNQSTLCTNSSLPNGPHTFEVHYKDTAGNIGSPQSLSFTVSIY